jgi:hypothetical protein
VSTDGGASYTSLACTNTNSDNVPNAHPLVLQNVPGYSGLQTTFRTESCDLSAYAGQTVILMFRGVTDWEHDRQRRGHGERRLVRRRHHARRDPALGRHQPRRLEVGDADRADASRRLDDPARRLPLRRPHARRARERPDRPRLHASLDKGKLRRLIGDQADVVAALVTYDEPTEANEKYARYELRVNGALQPGG